MSTTSRLLVTRTILLTDRTSGFSRLVVEAGRQLSYQRHAHRSEVWTVVSGRGEVVLDGAVNPVSAGNTVSVQRGRRHAARAFDDLRIVEVQLGDALDEEDIERFGNWWEPGF